MLPLVPAPTDRSNCYEMCDENHDYDQNRRCYLSTNDGLCAGNNTTGKPRYYLDDQFDCKA
jgi:hypothetical protein